MMRVYGRRVKATPLRVDGRRLMRKRNITAKPARSPQNFFLLFLRLTMLATRPSAAVPFVFIGMPGEGIEYGRILAGREEPTDVRPDAENGEELRGCPNDAHSLGLALAR